MKVLGLEMLIKYGQVSLSISISGYIFIDLIFKLENLENRILARKNNLELKKVLAQFLAAILALFLAMILAIFLAIFPAKFFLEFPVKFQLNGINV